MPCHGNAVNLLLGGVIRADDKGGRFRALAPLISSGLSGYLGYLAIGKGWLLSLASHANDGNRQSFKFKQHHGVWTYSQRSSCRKI